MAALAAKQLPDELLPRCLTRSGIDKDQLFLPPRSAPPTTDAPAAALPPTSTEQFDAARARKQALRDAGLATDEVDREIDAILAIQGDGRQLHAGLELGAGRYLLGTRLGHGGFAAVWQAYDRTERRHVAIKVLHSHLAGDLVRRERFFRGARVMQELVHPAVVRVHDRHGEDGAVCYFVMELVSGGTLRDAVLGKHIEGSRLWSVILQVGEALGDAHRRHLVHRDVKPANILLDEHGNAKLTDFDLVDAPDTIGGTRTGTSLGTLIYAAPELHDQPQEATAQADVFGLGITAIFCLTRRELSLTTFKNPEATVAGLDCSEPLREVLARAVAWEPKQRPPIRPPWSRQFVMRWKQPINRRRRKMARWCHRRRRTHE